MRRSGVSKRKAPAKKLTGRSTRERIRPRTLTTMLVVMEASPGRRSSR
jgi:hypothetical protein